MKIASSVFINTLMQLLAKLATTGSTLIVTYLISQKMGTVGLGEFLATTSYVALFYLLADFGVNAVFIKKANQINDDDKSKFIYLFENLLSLRIGLGVGIAFLAVAILSFLNYPANVKVAIIIGAGLILTQALFVTANAIFQVKLRYHSSAVAEIIGSVATLLLVFLALSGNLGVVFVIAAYLTGSIVKAVLALSMARRLAGGIGVGSDSGLWSALIASSLPLGMIAIFSQIMANIDKVILALAPLPSSIGYSNIEAVGVYGLAYKFFDVSLVIPTYLMNSAFPIFVRVGSEDKSKLKEITKKMALALIGLALVLLIIGIFLAPWVLSLFGDKEKLAGSVTSLRILLLGLPVFYLSALLVWLGVALEKQKYLIGVYGFSAITNLALNLWLIPIFGFIASAWITILCEAIIILGAVFMLREWWFDGDQA